MAGKGRLGNGWLLLQSSSPHAPHTPCAPTTTHVTMCTVGALPSCPPCDGNDDDDAMDMDGDTPSCDVGDTSVVAVAGMSRSAVGARMGAVSVGVAFRVVDVDLVVALTVFLPTTSPGASVSRRPVVGAVVRFPVVVVVEMVFSLRLAVDLVVVVVASFVTAFVTEGPTDRRRFVGRDSLQKRKQHADG